MAQNEQEKFSELFTNILTSAEIQHACNSNGHAYVVYNEFGILFSITFYENKQQYVFNGTKLFESEYKKYKIPADAKPDPQMVYETIVFSYKLRSIVKEAHNNVSCIYDTVLINSDIIFQMRGKFQTYMVTNSGLSGYAIGYNPETKQYGFKRYELIYALYKICSIPETHKPNYSSLYKKAKDFYLAQEAMENIQHLYD